MRYSDVVYVSNFSKPDLTIMNSGVQSPSKIALKRGAPPVEEMSTHATLRDHLSNSWALVNLFFDVYYIYAMHNRRTQIKAIE